MVEIEAVKETQETYWNELHNVFSQHENLSTCYSGDNMPRRTYGYGNSARKSKGIGPPIYPNDPYMRKKMLHTQGIHASVKLVSTEDNPYTGLYQGSDFGILRLSDAEFMLDPEYSAHQKYAPSLAIKFPITNQWSEQLLAMIKTGLNGSTEPYFFEEDQTNHATESSNDCVLNTVIRKFVQRTKWPFSIATSPFSFHDVDGNFVAEEDRRFPYEIVYKPNREAFPKADWNTDLNWLENLEAYSANFSEDNYPTIFEMWARDQPWDGDETLKHIGDIVLTSQLFRSDFGDNKLFYRHRIFE